MPGLGASRWMICAARRGWGSGRAKRVGGLDELDFPVALPVFQLFFAGDGFDDLAMNFVPYQAVGFVLLGETGDEAFAVLPDAFDQVRRDPDVERAVGAAGQDVDVRGFVHAGHFALSPEREGSVAQTNLGSRLRGNDGLAVAGNRKGTELPA